jgi:hypothetical protein
MEINLKALSTPQLLAIRSILVNGTTAFASIDEKAELKRLRTEVAQLKQQLSERNKNPESDRLMELLDLHNKPAISIQEAMSTLKKGLQERKNGK